MQDVLRLMNMLQSTEYNVDGIHNPQSAIRNPQATIHNPQSTICNPQSTNYKGDDYVNKLVARKQEALHKAINTAAITGDDANGNSLDRHVQDLAAIEERNPAW